MSKITIEENVEEVLDKKVNSSKTSCYINISRKHEGKSAKILIIDKSKGGKR
jgi:hypothetical protein